MRQAEIDDKSVVCEENNGKNKYIVLLSYCGGLIRNKTVNIFKLSLSFE